MAPSCQHGVPDSGSTKEKARLVEECDILLHEIVDVKERVEAFFAFWSHPSRSHAVDEGLAALYFKTATDALLDDTTAGTTDCCTCSKMEDFAYIETTFGIDIKEMAQKGVVKFMDDLKQHGQSIEHAEIVHEIRTRLGLLRFLTRQIPCSCLNDLLNEASR
jgi:hypothetical protein